MYTGMYDHSFDHTCVPAQGEHIYTYGGTYIYIVLHKYISEGTYNTYIYIYIYIYICVCVILYV